MLSSRAGHLPSFAYVRLRFGATFCFSSLNETLVTLGGDKSILEMVAETQKCILVAPRACYFLLGHNLLALGTFLGWGAQAVIWGAQAVIRGGGTVPKRPEWRWA